MQEPLFHTCPKCITQPQLRPMKANVFVCPECDYAIVIRSPATPKSS